MTGTWELNYVRQTKGEHVYVLKFRMENGHVCTFPLEAGHPIVLGLKSAAKMLREEPAS